MPWQHCAKLLALGLLVAACGFDAPGLDDGTDGPGDAAIETVTTVDTLASHFAGAGFTDTTLAARDAAADPDVAIEPTAYVPGGLRARLWDTLAMPRQVDATVPFDSIAATIPERYRGTGYGYLPTHENANFQRGLGSDRADHYTVILDGEVLLPVGAQELVVDGDDYLRVEVRTGIEWTSCYDESPPGAQTCALTTGAAGWYPIRIALQQAGGATRLALRIGRTGATAPVTRAELRAIVSHDRGLLVQAFAGLHVPVAAPGTPVADQLQIDHGTAPPYHLDMPNQSYTLRFTGQLQAAVGGAYQLAGTVGAEDEYRVWIDGALAASKWDATAVTGPVNLTPGWHDVIIDFRQVGSGAAFGLAWQPPEASAAAPIPPAALRPVATGGRYTFAVVPPDPELAITTAVTAATTPVAPPGARIQFVDAYFVIKQRAAGSVGATLRACEHPVSLPLTLTDGEDLQRFGNRTECAGAPVGAIALDLTETVDEDNGVLKGLLTQVTYRGGDSLPPFAQQAGFRSGPRATAGSGQLVRVALEGDLHGTPVRIEVRTAATAAALPGVGWTALDAAGAVPASVPPAAFAEYQLTFYPNGWELPAVESVTLVYRR